jgi:superfamily I DNA and RNA helicase
MLDVIFGSTRKRDFARDVAQALQQLDLDGSLYIGYPVFATADEKVTVDALLVSRQIGPVVIALLDASPPGRDEEAWRALEDYLDKLYVAVEANLRTHEELRRGRHLAVDPQVVGVFPSLPGSPVSRGDALFADLRTLPSVLSNFPHVGDELYRPLQAAIQRVTTIKPRKRREKAKTPQSRGSILKAIEREIANLDQLQKQAAIESPEGPQRIRGLAGSGKTIVLALKAAYLHAQHPEWVIAVTFQTRSLYQQFVDLIRRFSFEQINDEPNWDNLRVIHAWGGGGRDGVYFQCAQRAGVLPLDFLSARAKFGRERAFEGVCEELLAATADDAPASLYDAVLIDEAQDLPASFFQVVYHFTQQPKRVVWAYDDLQKLSEARMPSLEELFGRDSHGEPRVTLVSAVGARQDIVLERVYRNPPETLTVAHALGLGIYRKTLVQHFDDATLWLDIGYRVRSGSLEPGKLVTLERSPESYPPFFKELLTSDDIIVTRRFANVLQQANFVARSIRDELRVGELECDDILVVLPSALTAKSDARVIQTALAQVGLDSHLAGVTSSVDEIFRPNSIALAHIHRSKGNEAAMVYVVNADQCLDGPGLITLRNTLFTAITRSRAWTRVCGIDPRMAQLEAEINAVKSHSYALRFRVPTADELAKLRKIHRELSADERARIRRGEEQLRAFLEAVEKGELDVENLPADLRANLAKYFRVDLDTEYDDDE